MGSIDTDARCDSNRLSSVTKTGLTASYLYNALGQRVEKTVNGTTTGNARDDL